MGTGPVPDPLHRAAKRPACSDLDRTARLGRSCHSSRFIRRSAVTSSARAATTPALVAGGESSHPTVSWRGHSCEWNRAGHRVFRWSTCRSCSPRIVAGWPTPVRSDPGLIHGHQCYRRPGAGTCPSKLQGKTSADKQTVLTDACGSRTALGSGGSGASLFGWRCLTRSRLAARSPPGSCGDGLVGCLRAYRGGGSWIARVGSSETEPGRACRWVGTRGGGWRDRCHYVWCSRRGVGTCPGGLDRGNRVVVAVREDAGTVCYSWQGANGGKSAIR